MCSTALDFFEYELCSERRTLVAWQQHALQASLARKRGGCVKVEGFRLWVCQRNFSSGCLGAVLNGKWGGQVCRTTYVVAIEMCKC